MADWRLKPRAQRCVACGRPFAPGGVGHSLLMSEAEGGFARRDLCPGCFSALSDNERATASAAWTFSLPATSASRKTVSETAHRASAETVLRILVERGDPRDRASIYVLALLLERGKHIVERQVTTDGEGRRVHVYEYRGSGELISVTEPVLAGIDLPTVQRQVAALLEHGVRPQVRVRRSKRALRPRYRVQRKRR